LVVSWFSNQFSIRLGATLGLELVQYGFAALFG